MNNVIGDLNSRRSKGSDKNCRFCGYSLERGRSTKLLWTLCLVPKGLSTEETPGDKSGQV